MRQGADEATVTATANTEVRPHGFPLNPITVESALRGFRLMGEVMRNPHVPEPPAPPRPDAATRRSRRRALKPARVTR